MAGFTKTPLSDLAVEHQKQNALRTLGMGPICLFKAVDVMTYYRMKVRKHHPDADGDNVIPLTVDLQEIREAKDFLIAWLEQYEQEK